MKVRSWLQVPGNDAERLAAAMGTGADAVVVDIGCVGQDELGQALAMTNEWLTAHRTNVLESRAMSRWVRIHALDSGARWRDDLLAVIPAAPDGIVLPRAAGPDMVRQLAAEMYEIEQRNGIEANSIRIVPILGETPAAALAIPQFVEAGHQRLFAFAWQPGDLAGEIGAGRKVDARGGWTCAFAQVRAQMLLAAHASGLVAIDALRPGCEDSKILARFAREGRADGFAGMLLDDPGQVPVVNAAFSAGSAATGHAVRKPVLDLVPEEADEEMDEAPPVIGGRRVFGGATLRPA
ncbi:MAG: aldolase/citrate lyase family protein [Sphingomonadaceae bacterium]